jgi:NAD-dependent SIR2 family protein deacetylase
MRLINQATAFLAATDVVIVVGTSGMCGDSGLFCLEALQHGAYVIDINPEISEVSG